MNNQDIQETVAPFYTQFNALGNLLDDENIEPPLFHSAEKFYFKQMFFELGLLSKTERKRLKRIFKLRKQQERFEYRQQAAQARKARKAVIQAARAARKQPRKDARAARWVERKEERLQRKPHRRK